MRIKRYYAWFNYIVLHCGVSLGHLNDIQLLKKGEKKTTIFFLYRNEKVIDILNESVAFSTVNQVN